MYVVETTKGKYAVKALDSSVMARPESIKNFIKAEFIANISKSLLLKIMH